MDTSRRSFIRNSVIAGALLPVADMKLFAAPFPPQKLKVYIFSKHLQFLNYKELAEASAEMGFDGIDLSVRPGGHVEPGKVNEDLPKVVEEMKKVGFKPALMTTAVNEANNKTDRNLISTAAKLGFTHYRMNWYSYPQNKNIPDALNEMAKKVDGLGALNKQLGITGCYQNHAGLNVGSVIWEIYELLKHADKAHMGTQYDIRHAMVEGAESWENGFRLLHERIKAISLKDYRWKNDSGKWKVEDVPIGDGMVDFNHYFKLIKQYNIDVPVSLHIEYDLGGAEKGSREIKVDRSVVYNAMKKDLQKIHEMWAQA